MEGRPPGEVFSHQRWDEFFPKVGYVFTLAQLAAHQSFFAPATAARPFQGPNAVWTYGTGNSDGAASGTLPPPLIKGRYGEPIMHPHLQLSADRSHREWRLRAQRAPDCTSTTPTMVRKATAPPTCITSPAPSTTIAGAPRSPAATRSIPTPPIATAWPGWQRRHRPVAGDYREYPGHHVGPRPPVLLHGRECLQRHAHDDQLLQRPRTAATRQLNDGTNLRLPSGKLWTTAISISTSTSSSRMRALDPDGQYFFDIFTTDGMIGDMPLVNFGYAPFMEVLPRKYRFRILAASMSRFWKFAHCRSHGKAVPFQFIANDGNLVVNPITLTELDEQGIAERYDIVVDFSRFRVGDRLHLVDMLKQTSGNKPDGAQSLADALRGDQQRSGARRHPAIPGGGLSCPASMSRP